MRRDMELIREILLKLEDEEREFDWSEYSNDEINYHLMLVLEAELASGDMVENHTLTNPDAPAAVSLDRLTWQGHDFLEAIADDSRWSKIKKFLKEAGKVVTIETIKLAAKQLFETLPPITG